MRKFTHAASNEGKLSILTDRYQVTMVTMTDGAKASGQVMGESEGFLIYMDAISIVVQMN